MTYSLEINTLDTRTESDELARIIISWPVRPIDKVHEHSS